MHSLEYRKKTQKPLLDHFSFFSYFRFYPRTHFWQVSFFQLIATFLQFFLPFWLSFTQTYTHMHIHTYFFPQDVRKGSGNSNTTSPVFMKKITFFKQSSNPLPSNTKWLQVSRHEKWGYSPSYWHYPHHSTFQKTKSNTRKSCPLLYLSAWTSAFRKRETSVNKL